MLVNDFALEEPLQADIALPGEDHGEDHPHHQVQRSAQIHILRSDM